MPRDHRSTYIIGTSERYGSVVVDFFVRTGYVVIATDHGVTIEHTPNVAESALIQGF